MFENQTPDDKTALQIVDGMTVFASDGEKLGIVRSYMPQNGFIDVHKGWLFPKDLYVPLSEVDTVAEDGVTLKLVKAELRDEHYTMPAAAPVTAPNPRTLIDTPVADGVNKLPIDASVDGMRADSADLGDTLRAEQPFRTH